MHSARYLGHRMADQNVSRKLAAILAADVAGYSRLIGTAEEETVRRLNTYREVIVDLIVNHQGRVFGSAGDSVVAEFASPVEAVSASCAVRNSGSTSIRTRTCRDATRGHASAFAVSEK